MLLLFLIGCVAATVNPEPAPVQRFNQLFNGTVFDNKDRSVTVATSEGSNAYPYAYAVDFSGPASNFSCLKSSNYRTVFVRVYDPSGDGQFDTTSISNINQAGTAGLGVEAYMTPQIRSSKNASMQFDEVLNGLNAAGINLRKLWIQVTAPANWDPYPQKNVYFLNQIVMAAQRNRIALGFYTNFYDWTRITYNARGSNSQLWYWNVRGEGPQGETGANFYDFRPFGSWFRPTVKQFAQAENVCGMTVNRDVYSMYGMKDSVAINEESGKGPVVGATFGTIAFEGLLQNK